MAALAEGEKESWESTDMFRLCLFKTPETSQLKLMRSILCAFPSAMGKKQSETPNINNAANKDIIQRLNFLYQASVYLQSLDVDQSRNLHGLAEETGNEVCADKKYRRKTKRTKRRKTTSDLSRDYIHCMRQVAQKTTVKMCGNLYLKTKGLTEQSVLITSDPSLKRSLCFPCNSALVPGVSVSVRVEGMDHLYFLFSICSWIIAVYRICNAYVPFTIHLPEL